MNLQNRINEVKAVLDAATKLEKAVQAIVPLTGKEARQALHAQVAKADELAEMARNVVAGLRASANEAGAAAYAREQELEALERQVVQLTGPERDRAKARLKQLEAHT